MYRVADRACLLAWTEAPPLWPLPSPLPFGQTAAPRVLRLALPRCLIGPPPLAPSQTLPAPTLSLPHASPCRAPRRPPNRRALAGSARCGPLPPASKSMPASRRRLRARDGGGGRHRRRRRRRRRSAAQEGAARVHVTPALPLRSSPPAPAPATAAAASPSCWKNKRGAHRRAQR